MTHTPDASAQPTALIVSAHPLFREGIARLLGDQAVVVGSVASWQEVQGLGLAQAPNVIIVDHDSPELKEKDLTPLLWPDADDLRVIYVTLAGDKMTVHERHQVSGAGEADLLRALKGERPGAAYGDADGDRHRRVDRHLHGHRHGYRNGSSDRRVSGYHGAA